MTRKETVNLAANYESIETIIDQMIDTQTGTLDAILADGGDIRLIAPSAASCHRRLQILAGIIGKIASVAGRPPDPSHAGVNNGS